MLLLVDKPTWYTSFDIIRKLQKIYPGEKIWHAWTLDPLATWLLVIALGKSTKRLHALSGVDKTYEVTIDLTQMSDTRDSDARQDLEQYPFDADSVQMPGMQTATPAPSIENIHAVLDRMLQTTVFPLPPFSAKKVRGKKLYEYARAWQPLYIDAPMRVDACNIVAYQRPHLSLCLDVWSGTYIRSLAYWIGNALGTWWIVVSLRRTRVGLYEVPTTPTLPTPPYKLAW